MKKWLALMLVLLMVPVFCYSEGAEPFTFLNGITFGMAKEELDQKAYEMGSQIIWAEYGYNGIWADAWRVCQRYNALISLMPSTSLQMVYISIQTNVPKFENDTLSMEDYNYIRRALTALYGEENPNLSELCAAYWAQSTPNSWTECKGLFWEKENVNILLWQQDGDGDGQMDIVILYLSPDIVQAAASACPPEKINTDWVNVVPSWYAPLEESSESVDTTGL